MFFLLLAEFVISATILGCGSSGPERLYLGGQITYDGQPVDSGDITFSPLDRVVGVPAGAMIHEGRYEIDDAEGPTSGTYKVVITAMRPSGKKNAGEGSSPPADLMAQYIPAAYNEETTLQVEITDDRDDLDFHLEKVAATPARR